MKKLSIALLFAMLACAEQRVNRIVNVKNMDANRLASKLGELTRFSTPASPLGITTVQNNIVLSGSEETVAATEQLIKMLDVPEPKLRDIEVTGFIVLATHQAAADGGPMPAELDPVLKQFRSLLLYKSFRVLDTIILRGKENSAMGSSGFLALPGVTGATTDFRVQRPSVSDDVIRLKDLYLLVRLPTGRANDKGNIITNDVHIGTDADVKAGQKVAIGKASVDANGDALILVVSANVVN
jgi:hypothetical protein